MTAADWEALANGPQTGRAQHGTINGLQPGWSASGREYQNRWRKMTTNSRAVRESVRQRKIAGRMYGVLKSEKRRHRGFDGRDLGRGSVNLKSAWVTLLVAMEPKRWYGAAVLGQLVGRPNAFHSACRRTRLFLEQGINPKFQKHAFNYGHDQQIAGKHFEPRILWKLNPWGEALRAVALDHPELKVVDAFKLPGAKPQLWRPKGKPTGRPPGPNPYKGKGRPKGIVARSFENRDNDRDRQREGASIAHQVPD